MLNKSKLKREVMEIYQECADIEWVGCGEDPITQSNYQVAADFVDVMPKDIHTPTLCADSDGCISFEWYKSTKNVLSVTVSIDWVFYASYVDEESDYGKFPREDGFPEVLIPMIKSIHEKKKKTA